MRRLLNGAFAALLLSLAATPALADGDKDKGEKHEKADKGDKDKDKDKDEKREKADEKRDGGATAARHDDDDDDDEPKGDGGKAVAGRRTPAQLAFRKSVWERNEKAVEAKAHKSGKKLTEPEREAIKAHWLRVARLLRIRELAQEDKNDAVVKRVDAALEREEKKIDAKLDQVQAKTDGGAK